MNSVILILVIAVTAFTSHVRSHGMVIDPPNRSSIWRYVSQELPENLNDNALFCGGFDIQYNQNGGKCGLCGDNWADRMPRANEDGGLYGNGVIGGSYKSGGVLSANVLITAAHKGYFLFSICNMDVESESEECFDKHKLKLVDGSDKYDFGNKLEGEHRVNLRLPEGLACQRCVLRWHYHTGNNWGMCDDGTGAVGCGQQETFKTCSDITIHAAKAPHGSETLEEKNKLADDVINNLV